MRSLRMKLLVLLMIQVVLIVSYSILKLDWIFYSNLFCGMLTAVYAFSIQCPACHKQQVFRGWSVFDLRLPSEKCYSCGTRLKESNKRSEG
jgi:rRNA maturation endonuclease Nob1